MCRQTASHWEVFLCLNDTNLRVSKDYGKNRNTILRSRNRKAITAGLYAGPIPAKNLLVFAHCDDIAIGIGGYTKLLHAAGSSTTSVILTDQGRRKGEELQASKVLGIGETIFLNFEDGKFTENEIQPAVDQIGKYVDIHAFDNIVSFDFHGYTGHPDHMTASRVSSVLFSRSEQAKFLTWRSMSRQEKELWEPYFIPIPDQTMIPAQEVDIRHTMRSKRRAVGAHRSQYPIDGRNHLRRMQQMSPTERLRIIQKPPAVVRGL